MGNKVSNKRIQAIHKMVESIIKGANDEAEDHLHDYLQTLSREIILGEMEDEEDDTEMVARDSDSDDDEDPDAEDDDDAEADPDAEDDDVDPDADPDAEDDDDMNEQFAQPTDGVMSKKVVPNTKRAGKSNVEKHGNSSKHLDDKIKGKAKYARYPKGKSAEKHGNAAPGLKDEFATKCDGRDKNLGTTD